MAPSGTMNEEGPGEPVPDYSPEARRRAALSRLKDPAARRAARAAGSARFAEVARRVAIGTWDDGFTHAGNLAYITMLAMFPFFILGSAIFSAIGEEAERAAAINAVVTALPPSVGRVIGPAAREVVAERSGWLLWTGGAFALWTVGSLIESIRDILRRAYGTVHTKSFWHHRLMSAAIIIGAVILLVLALVAQVFIGAAEEAIDAWAPQLSHALDELAFSRAGPAFVAFFAIYMLFLWLTPMDYRGKRYPKWPGALLVTLWWVGVTLAFPPLLRAMFSYSLTYGSLAGIMISLFFFWLVGLGVVAGAELNAALARTPEEEGATGMDDASEQEDTAR